MTFTVTHTFTRTDIARSFFGAYADGHPDDPATKAQLLLKSTRKEMGVQESTTISADKLTATTVQVYADKAQFDKFKSDHADEIALLDTARRAYMQGAGITHTVATEGE